jgi:hypothetical protein
MSSDKSADALTDERSVLNLALDALRAFAGADDFRGWHEKYYPAIEMARRALTASKEFENAE